MSVITIINVVVVLSIYILTLEDKSGTFTGASIVLCPVTLFVQHLQHSYILTNNNNWLCELKYSLDIKCLSDLIETHIYSEYVHIVTLEAVRLVNDMFL